MSPAYHVGALERVREISRRVIAYGEAMGLDMIEGDYEDAGQLELNFAHDDCLATCDRLTTYRQICMQVARELDVTATFMPKPAVGVMANGCHHNLSLWRGEENAFADPSRRELHLTDTARHALGGLLAHAGATTAVAAPTVNSYARFWDAGQFAPAAANWGFDNRTCTVRVSANGRLEWKLPDASVNPYLTHAVALAAMRDGLERELDPGPPEQSSGYDDEVAARARFAPLPRTLGDALDALAADDVVAAALTPELLDVFCELKRDEWARFLSAVTEWHRETYLHVVP
jgi:glutamine synthetase